MPTTVTGNTGKKTIGGTAAAITLPNAPLVGVRLYTDAGNTATVYHGFVSTITAGSADATDGFPMVAGSSDFIPANALATNGTVFYVIAGASGQKIYWKAE